MLIVCVDGLTGFPNAIEAIYPKAEIQKCVIHQIRNTTWFVSYKDIKPLMADLKRVYTAVDEPAALAERGIVGQEISQNRAILAGQLGRAEHLLQVSGRSAQNHLYHQCHRGFQPSTAQGDQVQIRVSHGRQPAQNAVSGDDGYHQEMDGASAGLGFDPFPA